MFFQTVLPHPYAVAQPQSLSVVSLLPVNGISFSWGRGLLSAALEVVGHQTSILMLLHLQCQPESRPLPDPAFPNPTHFNTMEVLFLWISISYAAYCYHEPPPLHTRLNYWAASLAAKSNPHFSSPYWPRYVNFWLQLSLLSKPLVLKCGPISSAEIFFRIYPLQANPYHLPIPPQ